MSEVRQCRQRLDICISHRLAATRQIDADQVACVIEFQSSLQSIEPVNGRGKLRIDTFLLAGPYQCHPCLFAWAGVAPAAARQADSFIFLMTE